MQPQKGRSRAPPFSSLLDSIPLTTSEESTTKSESDPYQAEKKPVAGHEAGGTVQDSDAPSSNLLSGSSMVLISESETGKGAQESTNDAPSGMLLELAPPLFSPAKELHYEAPSKHDLPRKDASKRGRDWSFLGLIGVLGIVLLGGMLLTKGASR